MPSNLPTVTVTLLLTDLEGSTRLWERHPEWMAGAVARHFQLLGAVIEAHGGCIFKTQGDSAAAAFPNAPGALRAALEAQLALRREHWGGAGPLVVRMALHTGAPYQEGGEYTGPTVHRAHRLLAAAHGGQVLLCAATQELVRDGQPPGAELLDLGQHQLPDLSRPERIFQAVHPDLPARFPPLRGTQARATNLPPQRTPLLGREQELQALRALVPDGPSLVTLTGPGGTGKTRLAQQLGWEVLDRFPGGVYFIPLAAVSDPALAAPTIAHTLGLREEGDPLQSLVRHLGAAPSLLILDNFEQMVPAAEVVSALLEACPRLKIVVTSRKVLHLSGEQEFSVPPLALPGSAAGNAEAVSQYAAVRLFIDRARAVQPEFTVTNENAPAVAQICARLDGLPLAIELAAARIRLLSPDAMLARLDRRLRLLTRGPRNLPDRQQTLRNAIAWGYDLLTEPERQLYRRLAVFSGGFTLEAAASTCGKLDEGELLELSASLIDKSFLRPGLEEGRFGMLETIREFGLEALAESGEAEVTRAAHARYFAGLAGRAAPLLRGASQQAWLDRLEVEQANLRSAFRWVLDAGGDGEIAWTLAGGLWRFWFLRGYMGEGWQILRRLFERDPEGSVAARAAAYSGAAFLAFFHGNPEECAALVQRSLELCEAAGDEWNLAFSLCGLAMTAQHRGEWETARPAVDRALALARRLGDPWLVSMATTAYWPTVVQFGDYAGAEAMLAECVAISRRAEDLSLLAWPLAFLGTVHLRLGNPGEAVPCFREALSASHSVENKPGLACSLEGLAAAGAAQGRYEDAACLLGAAEALRVSAGCPRQLYEEPLVAETRAALAAVLGHAALTRKLEEGGQQPLDTVLGLASG